MSASYSKKDFDTSASPADDFYRYVNGGWLKRAKMPETENRWGSFYILRKDNHKRLHKIVNKIAESGSKNEDTQKIRDLYLSAMNIKKRNKEGLKHLGKEIDLIESMKDKKDLICTIAHLHMQGVGILWNPYIDQDDKDSEKMVGRIHQGGLGMPDRDYYIKKDKDSVRIKEAYKRHIKKMFVLGGKYSKLQIDKNIKIILDIETKLAHASMTRVERRNIEAQYNKKTTKELIRLSPEIDWREYSKLIGIGGLKTVIVDQPSFIKEVNKLFKSVSVLEWKVYFYWHLIESYAGILSEDFMEENFAFNGKVVTGAKKMRPQWERSLMAVDGILGDALGRAYVREYFPQSAKRKMNKLVDNIFFAYKERIERLDWMSEKTKKQAVIKLKKVERKIGYPDKWMSYKKLHISRESHVLNCKSASQFYFKREIAKLSKPVDKKEWHMTAPTVNAYYNPSLNEIVFPAGILQSPFFSEDADSAVNYGAIGAVIGHEMTHGFDDQGSQFDEKGNRRNWWTSKDKKQFEKKSQVLVKQFSKYHVIDGMYVNGSLTLGENIADLGGLVIAYDALQKSFKGKEKKKIDGFTEEQRFFIGAAIAERALSRPESLKLQVRNDPHSPAEFRVNGPLSNMDVFYDAFDVKKGNKMFRPIHNRAFIW